MSTVPAKAKIGPNDRLGMTLLIAGILHTVAALGVTFERSELDTNELPSLDVILVQTRSEEAPEKADFIAQANQQGGGESEEKARPSDLFSAPVPKLETGIAPIQLQELAELKREERKRDTEVITVDRSEHQRSSDFSQEATPEPDRQQTAEQAQRAMEMARLQAELRLSRQAYAKRPKRKFISANTREDGFARYMQSWVAKVERVGNINYPEEARLNDLQGSLVLTVAIRRDGTIEKIEIIQSSGEAVLDDAAKRIVEIAAPFDPTPVVDGEQFDILHITRTWQFLPGNVLQSH